MNKLPKNSLNEFQKQNLRLLSHKPEFQARVSEIRKRWCIQIGSAVIAKNRKMKKDQSSLQSTSFDDAIWEMMRELNQPRVRYLLFESYVLYDDFFHTPIGRGINELFLRQNPRVFGENGRLFLEIYEDTTLQDVKRIWKSIVEVNKPGYLAKKNIATRRKPLKNFDRDERMYILRSEGKTSNEIREIIKKEFGGRKIPYDTVPKIIERFRQEIMDA